MEHSVKVTIEYKAGKVIVSNNFGKFWEYKCSNMSKDSTLIASLASGMLTSTIVSNLYTLPSKKISFTLTIDTNKDN